MTGMIRLHQPSSQELRECLASGQDAPLSYVHRAGVDDPPHEHFLKDTHLVFLGTGEVLFQRMSQALDDWLMLPGWVAVSPPAAPQRRGQVFASVMKLWGMWWVNPGRILHRCDSHNRHGFVFGTLPEHAECGEERFLVEMQPDGSVWYEIKSFSQPRHWLTWAGFPVARWWQLKFVRDSQTAMKRLADNHG